MCVAGLNVSTQPCQHRWAHLKRSCDPANNLANCPERLKLEGWESRVDHCPFCEEHPTHESTHRLFGNTSSSSISAPASPEIPGMTRASRSGSLGTISTLSRQNSCSSESYFDRGQMHREMNDRLINYLITDPHENLPSAKKNYPTYSTASSSTKEESTASDAASVRSATQSFSRSWKKGVRFSKGMFKT